MENEKVTKERNMRKSYKKSRFLKAWVRRAAQDFQHGYEPVDLFIMPRKNYYPKQITKNDIIDVDCNLL